MDSRITYLETQVEVLTSRLTNAEAQIRQLTDLLTTSMRNDKASNQRVIKTLNMINAERKLSNSKKLSQAAMTTAGTSSSVPENSASVPLDAWEFNENMDLDWDAFDGIDLMTLVSSTSLPKVPIQEPVNQEEIAPPPIRSCRLLLHLFSKLFL